MARNSTPARGTYTGTGAAVNVVLGFKPGFVFIYNFTDGDVTFQWSDTMAEGTAVQTDTAVAKLASNGISLLDGSTGAGFIAGSSVSESAKVFHYVAWPKD